MPECMKELDKAVPQSTPLPPDATPLPAKSSAATTLAPPSTAAITSSQLQGLKKGLTALLQEDGADINETMAPAVMTNLGVQLAKGEGEACYHHVPGPDDVIDPAPCIFFSHDVEADAWADFQGTTTVEHSWNREVLQELLGQLVAAAKECEEVAEGDLQVALGQADDDKQAMELEDNVDDLADDAATVDLDDAMVVEPEDEQ